MQEPVKHMPMPKARPTVLWRLQDRPTPSQPMVPFASWPKRPPMRWTIGWRTSVPAYAMAAMPVLLMARWFAITKCPQPPYANAAQRVNARAIMVVAVLLLGLLGTPVQARAPGALFEASYCAGYWRVIAETTRDVWLRDMARDMWRYHARIVFDAYGEVPADTDAQLPNLLTRSELLGRHDAATGSAWRPC